MGGARRSSCGDDPSIASTLVTDHLLLVCSPMRDVLAAGQVRLWAFVKNPRLKSALGAWAQQRGLGSVGL